VSDFAWSAWTKESASAISTGDGRLDLVVSSGTEKQKRISVLHNDLPPRHWFNVRPAAPRAMRRGRREDPPARAGHWKAAVVRAGDDRRRQTARATTPTARLSDTRSGDRAAVDIRVEFHPSGKSSRRPPEG